MLPDLQPANTKSKHVSLAFAVADEASYRSLSVAHFEHLTVLGVHDFEPADPVTVHVCFVSVSQPITADPNGVHASSRVPDAPSSRNEVLSHLEQTLVLALQVP
jgi:voltage-gated potassium channel Kch